MNTLFTSRLNGIFILNTLLELHKPVTVSCVNLGNYFYKVNFSLVLLT